MAGLGPAGRKQARGSGCKPGGRTASCQPAGSSAGRARGDRLPSLADTASRPEVLGREGLSALCAVMGFSGRCLSAHGWAALWEPELPAREVRVCDVRCASLLSLGVSVGSGSAVKLKMLTAVCIMNSDGGVPCDDYCFKRGNLKSG